ncbi:MAG TPA: hydantoinase B/oxoprolinase family protein [Bryobacterales bacterium]|nr:hydantoinase B/oxoprolinase family protein [Bryobacterales bacterium]
MTEKLSLSLDLFRNLFVSIAEEMGIVLRRTSFSPNIKERRDYSCAVYDAQRRTVAMGDHMPVHLGAMPASVEAAASSLAMEPGDVVILNDPFRGGTHLPDITAVSGVFLREDEPPAYYVASRAHHSDVGGISPGSMPLAREIYQEGLRIPPVKLVKRGRMDEEILALLLANVRTPEERRGDLGAQIAAQRVGERRLLAATEKYGRADLQRRIDELLDYAERMMRARLAEIPDGVFRFEDFLDDDGISDAPVGIRCELRIEGSDATVDFSASDAQVAGSVNANRTVAVSATMYCFRCLIAEDVPYNAGLMRPVRVITRPGTVVDAQPPAGVAGGNVETSQRITDVVLGALAQALPDRIPAASSGTMNNLTLGGIDPRTGQPFAYYETIAGGMGARPNAPGLSAVHTHMTNSLNTPVEALEHFYPFRVRRYAVRRGSGGAGKFRGGDGIIKQIELLADAEVTILSDRRRRGPYGLAGGQPGKPGVNRINGKRVASKARLQCRAGDVLTIETPGGGGWGKR